MDDPSFNKLLKFFNLSWNGYRKVRKGVKKRIVRHMQALGLNNIDDYLKIVEKNEDIRKICCRHLSVSISRFYRDRNLWDGLNDILPCLLNTFADEPKINVWSCGCARGEEAYSFLMLWESLKNKKQFPQLDIISTDINPEYLKLGREGLYEFRSLKELPTLFIEKYFSKLPDGNRYKLHPSLIEKVTFKHHNFIEETPPLKKFHIIFARNNLLTYYNFPEKTISLLRIINSLMPAGVLIIGSHEKVPENISHLRRCPKLPFLYYKI
jgi:chemotaxis protein methyltransferase CheR